jgi:hypothetical protein
LSEKRHPNLQLDGVLCHIDVVNVEAFSMHEHAMRKVLRGYAKDKNGNLILVGAIPAPFSKDKCPPVARYEKRHLVRQGATIFKKETIQTLI